VNSTDRRMLRDANKRLSIYRRLRAACEDYQSSQRYSTVDSKTFHILAAVNTVMDSIQHKFDSEIRLIKLIEGSIKYKAKKK